MDQHIPKTMDDLLNPVSEDVFFAEYYDRKPVHIPGAPEKLQSLMDWDMLEALLNMTGIWSSSSLMLVLDRQILAPSVYCAEAISRDGKSILQPVPEKVMSLLRKGASLVANDIDTFSPGLRATAGILEKSYGGKVQANLYCSWPQRQAFDSHFDCHDVFALHVEGKKTWRIFETRFPHPIRHEKYTSLSKEDHQRNRGAVMMEVEMTPGDILYIPRGWYHDALADPEDGGSVHIALGVTGLIGLDFIGALSDLAVNEEVVRMNFPRPSEGRDAMAEHLSRLSDALGKVASDPGLTDSMIAYQRSYRYQRGGISLPVIPDDPVYRLKDLGARLGSHNGAPALVAGGIARPVPADMVAMVQWVLETRDFARSEFIDAFQDVPIDRLDAFLRDMVSMDFLGHS